MQSASYEKRFLRLLQKHCIKHSGRNFEQDFMPVNSSESYHHSLMVRPPDQPQNPKILKVMVLGMPNAGKSTFINSVLGRRILPTSSKIDTTTQNVLAVKTVGDTQIIFQDTPGMMSSLKAKRHRISSGLALPQESFFESDLGIVMGDLTSRRLKDGYLQPEILLAMIKNRHVPTILVLNKMDKYKKKDHLLVLIHLLTAGCVGGVSYEPERHVLTPMKLPKVKDTILTEYKDLDLTDDEQLKQWMGKNESRFLTKLRYCRGWPHFQDVFAISAKEGIGLDGLRNYMLSHAKPRPWIYHSEVRTDATPSQVVLDSVRAGLLEQLPQEIPYCVMPTITDWQETEDGRLVIDIEIICGKQSHFNIVSNKCRSIGKDAQEYVQDTFFLEAYVRVNPVLFKNFDKR